MDQDETGGRETSWEVFHKKAGIQGGKAMCGIYHCYLLYPLKLEVSGVIQIYGRHVGIFPRVS